jgi:hypothetical protein
MKRERFLQLLEAYGGRESAWPAEERAAMQALIDADDEARRHWLCARELDLVLDSYQPPLPDLSERILAALPRPGPLERLLVWLFPGGSASVLRPALAGALPLLLGIAVGLNLPPGASDTQVGSWEAQERFLMTATEPDANWYE